MSSFVLTVLANVLPTSTLHRQEEGGVHTIRGQRAAFYVCVVASVFDMWEDGKKEAAWLCCVINVKLIPKQLDSVNSGLPQLM